MAKIKYGINEKKDEEVVKIDIDKIKKEKPKK